MIFLSYRGFKKANFEFPAVLDVSLKVFALKLSLFSFADERHKSHLVSPLCFNILPLVHVRSRHDEVAGLKG